MLKQASVSQIRRCELKRGDAYLVVCMCYYPRGLHKELRDEYRSDLAPSRELFQDFKRYQKTLGHDAAFIQSRYLQRFSLSASALDYLEYLTNLAKNKDVYLICQCDVGQRCHRELLLLIAKKYFNARIDQVFHVYSDATILKRKYKFE